MRPPFGFKEIYTDFGLFDFQVVCIVGEKKNINAYVQWKLGDKNYDIEQVQDGYESNGLTIYRKNFIPVIWIPRKPKTPKEYSTLCHESIHAALKGFEWAGLRVNDETEEVLTHAVAHLVENILSNLK